METENELPMLAGIAGFIHWWEELLNIVNGPVLLFGAGIALVDLLTDGQLTATATALLFAWAISQALGIDTQLLGCFSRARHASGWPRVGWLALGVVLGYAAWQAGDVYALQQSEHIGEAAALAQLGMPSQLWLGWRAFLAVGLVALSGWTRYRRPAKVTSSLEVELAQLQRELMLEPLRLRLRAQQVGGIRTLAQTALRSAGVTSSAQTGIGISAHFEASHEAPTTPPQAQQTAAATIEAEAASSSNVAETPDKPPTGPGSPAVVSKRTAGNVTPLRRSVRGLGKRPRTDRRTANRANARSGRRGTVEQRIRAALAANPTMSHVELVRLTGVSDSSASKYLRLIEAERAAEQRQAAQ
ncbi:MAG TPA: hypothetical protein VE338_05940 [Ktedonobacterales bacterium]|nr:hypothetical protein [Ktedonobacterales bacterium]